MKTKPTHTPTDTAMENIAVLDCLTREGFGENTIDRVERAINAYDYLKNTNALLLDALKRMGATWHNQFCSDTGHESECIMADEAIAQAEGGSNA